MIHKTTLSEAIAAAGNFTAAGKVLKPINGEIVAKLVDSTNHLYEGAIGAFSEEGFAFNNASLLGALEKLVSARDQHGVVENDAVMAEIVPTMIETVRLNMDIARNNAIPLIAEVESKAAAILEQRKVNTIEPYAVVADVLSPMWKSFALGEMVNNYAKYDFNAIKVDPKVVVQPAKESVVILDKLKTGVGSIDELLPVFIETLGEGMLSGLYSDMFVNGNLLRNLGDAVNPYLRQGGERDIILAIFLFANNAFNAIPADAAEDSGRKLAISQIKVAAGAGSAALLKKREDDISVGRMIYSYPIDRDSLEQKACIYVNWEVYTTWLREEAGDIDYILGSAVTDRQYDRKKLVAEGLMYKGAWQRYVATREEKVRSEIFNNTIGAFMNALSQIIYGADETELPVPKAEAQKRLVMVMSDVEPRHIDNHNHLARMIVCRTLFAHLDTEDFLIEVERQTKLHPDLPVESAVFFGLVETVVSWLALFIVPTNIE